MAPKRVAVLRALPGVGDFLCSVPALRALRAALPQARILLLGLPRVQALVERFDHYLDGLLPFPGFPGIPEMKVDLALYPLQLARLLRQDLDLLIQMHGAGRVSNLFVELVGARHVAAFVSPDGHCPEGAHCLPYPEHESEIWRNLRLIESLGVPLQGDHLEFPVTADDREDLARAVPRGELKPGEYVCVHPGASAEARRWPARCFARVADVLASRGLRVVLTGMADERQLAAAVAGTMAARPVDLTGRTTLGALAALVGDARLIICNDTGISHLAAALRTPSVVIFTGANNGSDPSRWAPLDRRRHRLVTPASPDEDRSQEKVGPAGLQPSSVLAEASQLLDREWRVHA